jgi:hypothetical protein
VPAKAHAAIEALETHLDRQAANRRVRDRQWAFGASLASRESLELLLKAILTLSGSDQPVSSQATRRRYGGRSAATQ